MKVLNPLRWETALAAGLVATIVLLPQAKGQLVYENNSAAADAQVQERADMKQALSASEKAQATQAAVETAPAVETEHLSKAELMRRERQREELKNEDILQERLEELRLRDERRRTDEVIGAGAGGNPSVSTIQTAPLKEETVVAPVTEHPGKPSLAPAMASGTQGDQAPAGDALQSSISLAPGETSGEAERTRIAITPRAGLSSMVVDGTYLQVSPRFSAGLAAELGTGDYFSFQVGYLYSQYGVAVSSMNPLVLAAQSQASFYGTGFQPLNLNQNVFDAGAKVHMLGVDSKIRPFVGAGGAYGVSFINFAPTLLASLRASGIAASQDYTVKNFLGYLSAGSEFRVSKHISLGGEFRYYAVLSDQQSGNLGGLYGFYGGYNAFNQDPAIAGGALARNNFYSILGTLTFTF